MMTRKPRKGDRLIYTGQYATAADMAELGVAPEHCKDVDPYPPGTVVRFRDHGAKVTVLLDKQEGDTQDLYADWPISQVDFAPCNPDTIDQSAPPKDEGPR